MENVLPVTVATKRLHGHISGRDPALDKDAFYCTCCTKNPVSATLAGISPH
jgi:hypothetical protein